MSIVEDSVVQIRAAFPPLLPWQIAPASSALRARAGWPHGLLLYGPHGIGKRTLALHYARALLCESPAPDGTGCGICASCRYVGAGQHPDLRLVEPLEHKEDGEVERLAEIPIRHVRALIDFVQLTSHRRVAKVALIVPAERMNAEAANALLKTLEEPPAGTFLILVAHQPGRLPATVRSRCRLQAAPRPTIEEGLAWLAAQGVPEPAPLLAQAGGAPIAALALADAGLQAERRAWLTALARPERLSPVALAARVEAGGKEERRDRLAAAIDWLLGWVGDLAHVAAGGAPRRNPDFGAALDALAPRVARISLFRYHRALLRQRALLSHPLQPRLVVEALLIDYRGLFA